ncbi:MAG: glycoside hydrolase family 88 protein [Candidatus Hydrogenedentota bacterium]
MEKFTAALARFTAACLAMLGGMVVVGPASADAPRESEYVRIEGLGTWHAHPQPTAIREGNKTFFGTSDETGNIIISSYDHEEREWEHTIVDSDSGADDHIQPAILIRDDGRILAAWSKRRSDSDDICWAISENPHDVSEFGEIDAFHAGGGGDYPKLVQWGGEIRVYYRAAAYDVWDYRVSTDGGATWGDATPWLDFSAYDQPVSSHRVYAHVYQEGDQLHFVIGGYRSADKTVRHAYLEDGQYFDSHGNAVGTDGEPITEWEQMTRVWRGTLDHWTDSPNVNELLVKDGTPYITFEEMKAVGRGGGSGDIRARWASYRDGEWFVSGEIVDMGGEIPESEPVPGLYHKGAIAMDANDPYTVFVSVEVDHEKRAYQIQEWTTNDGGESWEKVWESNDGEVRGYEPHAKRGQALSPRNHDGEELRVLWWAGKHDRFRSGGEGYGFDVVIKTMNTVAPDVVETTPEAVAQRVADHYIETQTPSHHYGHLLTLYGLVRVAEATGREDYGGYVDEVLAELVREEVPDSPIGGSFQNYAMGGLAGMYRYVQGRPHGDEALLRSYAEQLIEEHPRDADGLMSHPSPGDRPPEERRIWVDCLMAICPFLSMSAVVLDEPELHEESIEQYLLMEDALFSEELGLFHQSKNFGPPGSVSPDTWGRGTGWALIGLVELIRFLPEDHPERDAMIARLERMMETLEPLQAPSGMWRQDLVTPESYEETSGTGLILYALAMGLRKGWLPETMRPMAEQAWEGLAKTVDAHGAVHGTCVGTRGASDAPLEFWLERPTAVDDSHGFGPVLLAAAEMHLLRTEVPR